MCVCTGRCVYVMVHTLQDARLYEEVVSLDELTGIVGTALDEYNNTHKNRMNLVIFRYTGM